tara:strand:+ start:463 stop:1566 length:1104 start_codon:yes stop_codon:yes gene_type:complete
MATTYLTLTNNVLRELNETELTSSTFASSRGVQTAVKDFVNKGIHDIYNETGEIPLLYSRTSQDLVVGDNEYDFPADFRKADMDSFFLKPKELVTNGEFTSNISNWTTGDGSPSHTSSGNGRLNLNDAAAYQAINTTVNKQYKLQVRVLSPNSSTSGLIIRVGTSAGGTQNLNTTKAVTNFREGAILNTNFTATAQTSFIYLESDGVQLDVDYVRISRSDIALRKLVFVTYDNYLQVYKVTDDTNNSGNYSHPLRVYILPDHSAFGVSPRPNTSEYSVHYDYYTTHTDLSAHGDNMSLPDRFATLIVDRAKYYTYMLRSDPQHAQLADRDFQRKLRLLKVDYATKNDYMRSDTIGESITTSIGGRAS